MHTQFNLWKATIAVIIYVAVCMLILCSSPDDDAAGVGTVVPAGVLAGPSDAS